MKHLLSPAQPGMAASREWYLNKADLYASKAEQCELQAIALSRCVDAAKRAEGLAAKGRAKVWRKLCQQAHARATDLTDYTHALDFNPPEWTRLEELREEAAARALTPAQLRNLTSNPYTSSLHVQSN